MASMSTYKFSTVLLFLDLTVCYQPVFFGFFIDLLKMTLLSADQVSSSSSKDQDYMSGMNTCVNEVIKFLTTTSFSNSDPEVKTKLLDHLANKLTCGTAHQSRDSSTVIPSSVCSTQTNPNFTCIDNNVTSTETLNSEDVNNNLHTNKANHTETSPLSPSYNLLLQQTTSPSKPTSTPPAQHLFQVPQSIAQTGNVPTVPVTILVPANFCSPSMGPTCVIPLTFPGHSPQFLTQSDKPNTISPTLTLPSLISPNTAINLSPNTNLHPVVASSFVVPNSPDANVDSLRDTQKPNDRIETKIDATESSEPLALVRPPIQPRTAFHSVASVSKTVSDSKHSPVSATLPARALNYQPVCDISNQMWRPW